MLSPTLLHTTACVLSLLAVTVFAAKLGLSDSPAAASVRDDAAGLASHNPIGLLLADIGMTQGSTSFGAETVAEPAAAVASDGEKKPSKKHFSNFRCCDDGSQRDSLYEGYRDLKKLCLREYWDNPSPPQAVFGRATETANSTTSQSTKNWYQYNREERQQEYICVSQCVARHINIVDNAGDLIDSAVHSNTHSLAQAEWQHQQADNISTACIAEVDAAPHNRTESGCNPEALQLFFCVWREFTLRCPANLQYHSRRCDALRWRLTNGDNLAFEAYLSFKAVPVPSAAVAAAAVRPATAAATQAEAGESAADADDDVNKSTLDLVLGDGGE